MTQQKTAMRFRIQSLETSPSDSQPPYAYQLPAKLPTGRIPSFQVIASLDPQASPFPISEMPSSHQLIIVITTVASNTDADHLARQLIDANLAACVQIEGPITSHYKWDGVAQVSTEYRMTIKTGNACWQDLKKQLLALHPYEQPEILMLPVTDTTDGYLQWVIQHTR